MCEIKLKSFWRSLGTVLLTAVLPSGCNPAGQQAQPPAAAPQGGEQAPPAAGILTNPATAPVTRLLPPDDGIAPPSAEEVLPAESKPSEARPAAVKPAKAKKGSKRPKAGQDVQPRVSKSNDFWYLAGIPLIPRDVLFGNPDKAAARISPDGRRIAFLAPNDGVLNVWVGPADHPAAARPVTFDKKRGIRTYHWAYTNEHILYLQDTGGDENWHVYCVDLPAGQTKDLTPLEKVNARIEAVSRRSPGEILVAVNDRNPQAHDIHQVNLVSGERKLVEENQQGFAAYVADDDLKVRVAVRFTPDGGSELLARDDEGNWKSFARIPQADSLTSRPIGFDKSGQVLYFIDSRRRNTGALTAWNLSDGKQEVLAENEQADITGVLAHPTEKTIEAVSWTWQRKEWRALSDDVAGDLEYLRSVADGEIEITSQSLDNRHWTVAYQLDGGPLKFYRYDRAGRKAVFLFNSRDDLKGLPLARMHSLVIETRDGLEMVGYLTLPPGSDDDGDARPREPLPLVLKVHGGPWARDSWGFDPQAQWLANRGYAVLAVNYRGSTGFGKKFVNAGNREWGGKMHDDLIDAVHWAIDGKIADPKRVAIMGGSYGGYATLAGLTFTPDTFACGVDIVGPSNILTLLRSIPPYWQPMVQMFKNRVGDFLSPQGEELLTERSPLTHVDRIERPLLIGQGANDPRVKQAESDQIVDLMKKKHIPVTYVLYPDEGHGFVRPENRLSFNAVAEAFLAAHLGGRYEPIGDAFHGSTITVPEGAAEVPGLAEALVEAGAEREEMKNAK